MPTRIDVQFPPHAGQRGADQAVIHLLGTLQPVVSMLLPACFKLCQCRFSVSQSNSPTNLVARAGCSMRGMSSWKTADTERAIARNHWQEPQ